MARAIAVDPQQEGVDGDALVMRARVLFYGNDLPAPDATVVFFRIEPGDGPAVIRDRFVAAIDAEAARMGVTLGNNGHLLPSYVRV